VRRFFVDQPISGPTAVVRGDEARHLATVLRAAPGDDVVLFDGRGAEFVGRVGAVSRSEVVVEGLERRPVDRELNFELTLGAALPKGDRQRWLVEKLVELGVARFVPLVTRRSVALPVEAALARLRRHVVEASKQCGRNRLMDVAPPQPWSQWLRSPPETDVCRLVGHPGGSEALNAARNAASAGALATAARVFACVGPEGGLTDEEVAQSLAAGWTTVDLGPRVLRIETAALLLVAAALAARGFQGDWEP
jgi:16S rRNA (uracil1498-N3)-methyltransferase